MGHFISKRIQIILTKIFGKGAPDSGDAGIVRGSAEIAVASKRPTSQSLTS